ncbi:MAG: glycogen debranching protein GlgX, partial [Rubrivivax sp.]
MSGPLQPGRPWPLGATLRDGGLNVAWPSQHAHAVELCLFDDDARVETRRLRLPGHDGDVFHGFLSGAGAGLVYGLRVHGPWRPERGHRFNAHKLLLDPWSREIVGAWNGGDEHLSADPRHPQHPDERDNAATALKSRVVDDAAEARAGAPLHRGAHDRVICELHVRSFTRRMPGVPPALRGTYLGLASDAAIAHLQRLGVTAVELLPVQQALDEAHLLARGLVNHWGYNTAGFFCPSPRFATRPDGATARAEFAAMVRRLHDAGIEVLLDVVFNHTAEGDTRGPTLAWRGLDNASWYRLPAEHRSGYENWSGCGNTLALQRPRVLQFVLDSLRHWVRQYHVDGFRFDLAPVLGRGDVAFERDGAFFTALHQDPLLTGTVRIAEPWDLGPGGYQLGHFPRGWLEWNDRFRDTMRAFWLGHPCTRGAFALRLAGSSDLLQAQGRLPAESVNFVTAHDGFTLADLVSYEHRRNQANGEHNGDGHGHNLSWNAGHEGPSDDAEVLQRRRRLQRALLATTLLAQGTPMLAAGSEIGHSQQGNNNAYCQDNAISWLDWDHADHALTAFVAHVLALRRELRPLGERWYTGLPDARGRADLAWTDADGRTLDAAAWNDPHARTLVAQVGAPGAGEGPLLLLFNAERDDRHVALPAGRWRQRLDTSRDDGRCERLVQG